MTLPGIAGFILTIGMGVDSNVLIFERIKEELGAGKRRAAGGRRRLRPRVPHHLDTHVASLISAAFLFQFGTGPIRGFATTLFFGLLSQRVHRGVRLAHPVRAHALAAPAGRAAAEHLRSRTCTSSTNPNFNFIKWRWHALALSVLIMLPASRMIVTQRPAARHRLLRRHDRRPEVPAAGRRGGGAQGARRDAGREGRAAVRRRRATTSRWSACRMAATEQGTSLEQGARRSSDALTHGQRRHSSRSISTEIVGPVDRQGPAAEGHLRHAGVARRHHDLHRVPVPVHVRHRRHRRDVARRARHPRLPDVLRLRPLAEHHRGAS